MVQNITFDHVLELARRLSPAEQQRLVELIQHEQNPALQSYPSLYGLWSDLGPAPSEDEIAEARKQMWGSFGQEDVWCRQQLLILML